MKLPHKWMPVIEVKKRTGRGLGVEACGPRCLMMDGELAVRTIPAWLPWEGDTSHGKWRTSEEGGAAVHRAGLSTVYSGDITCQS